MRRRLLPLILALAPALPAAGQVPIFESGFESGYLVDWSSSLGAVGVDAFRISDLDLRDPHVFVQSPLPPFDCLDFTDDPLPLVGTSFNGELAEELSFDDDGDGLLDLSLLLLFRPLETGSDGRRIDLSRGLCDAPVELTSCQLDPASETLFTTYSNPAEGFCLEAIPGTTSAYVPAIDEPLAPCFVTPAASVLLDLGGVSVPLTDVQVAGAYLGDPPSGLTEGLLRGFLTQADADTVLLPAELPVVGGQPLSTLLPGGSGSCAPGDDRDAGQTGWWLYLNFTADRVPYTGP